MSDNEEAKKEKQQKVSVAEDIVMLQAVLKRNPWEGARTDFTKALEEAKINSTFFINKKEAWMYNRCTTLMTDYRNNRTGSRKSSDITDSKKRDDLLNRVSGLEWKTLKWNHSGSDSEPQPGTSVVTSTNMGEEEMAEAGEEKKKHFTFTLRTEIIVLQKVIECYLWKQGESDFKTIVDDLKADDDFKELKISSIEKKIDELTKAFANQTLSDTESEGRNDEYEVRNKLVEIVSYLKGQPKSADAKGSHPARSPEEKMRSKKVELIITEDGYLHIRADDIVCIWSDEMLNVGPVHPLLQSIGVKLKNWSEFKEEIRSGQVMKTESGLEGIGQMLHYKTAWNVKEIIQKIFHVCKDSSIVVIPFSHIEALYSNVPDTVQALLRLVRNIQRCQRKCSIRKIIVSCGNKETKDHLDEQISHIKIKRTEPKEVCISCKKEPAAKIGHLSRHCDEACPSFCVDCLRQSWQNPLHCSDHGRCLSPVGHENCFALIIAGYDSRRKVAEIFINDANRMKEGLEDPNIVGIREENITMITTSEPAVDDSYMCERVIYAFKRFAEQISEKEHPFFLLYFTGHCNQTSLCFGGPSNRMTPKQIKEELQSLDAETVLIILDCCFSGGIDLNTFNDEDFTMSIQYRESKDNENCVLLPKLWNFYKGDDDGDAKKKRIRVKQWSSSYPDQRSFFIQELDFSLFTDCIIELLEGRCPDAAEDCEICQQYHLTAAEQEFVFLNNLHECVEPHMERLAQTFNLPQQQPLLVGNDDEDMVIAFYFSQT